MSEEQRIPKFDPDMSDTEETPEVAPQREDDVPSDLMSALKEVLKRARALLNGACKDPEPIDTNALCIRLGVNIVWFEGLRGCERDGRHSRRRRI